MEFIKAAGFTKYAYDYLSKDEVAMIPAHLLRKIAKELEDA